MESFIKKIDDITFSFKKVMEGTEVWYHITFTVDEKTTTLRMYKDEQARWTIATKRLHKKIQVMENKFRDAISENEESNSPKC